MYCVVLWADESATVETISQFSRLAKLSDRPPEPGKAPDCAPLLVFVDEKSEHLAQKEELSAVSFFSKSFDVRHLDANLSSIVEGKAVRVLHGNDTQKENAPEPMKKNDIKEVGGKNR